MLRTMEVRGIGKSRERRKRVISQFVGLLSIKWRAWKASSHDFGNDCKKV